MFRYLAVLQCTKEDYDEIYMEQMVTAAQKLTDTIAGWLKTKNHCDPILTVVLPAGVQLTIQKVDDEGVIDLEEVRVTYERSPKAPW